ncbi:MAG: Mur ligase family protein, partial [Gammaproteobacteria bacterium]|nr:Mur ligase family protein [Gammaproteobacteria bacterium]
MLASDAPLSRWLAWLETLSPSEINLGLERVLEVLGRLDLQLPPHVLTIAGTNGKGSSVAMADALLRASGMRSGAYTSPHIRRYNERIVVDGVAVGDAEIIASFERIEAARGEVKLTYFEFGTLAAFDIFAAANLDVWILEVGMGGRLDATNAIEPSACLITNISLDH